MRNSYTESEMNNGAYAAMLLKTQAPPMIPVFNGNNIQQMLALACLQNKQLWTQQLMQEYDMQKWINVVREHQVATAIRQATKTPRKRTLSVSSVVNS